MTTQPIIEVHGLSAGYDGRTVLHDIDLTVYENDFLGIIGPNGGGKTTLIKCILGLLKPTAGKITYNISTMGYLPQYNTIDRKFPISVEEVILSGLSSKKSLISRFTDEQREKVRSTIARMGLEGLESPPIRAFGRNKQRMRHYPCESRHRHGTATGQVHRLRQRNTGLSPGYGSHDRVAGT